MADTPVKMKLSQLIASYEETLGVEGAQKLIYNTLASTGLAGKKEFNVEDLCLICKALSSHHGFIATTAGILLARHKLHHWKTEASKIVSCGKAPTHS